MLGGVPFSQKNKTASVKERPYHRHSWFPHACNIRKATCKRAHIQFRVHPQSFYGIETRSNTAKLEDHDTRLVLWGITRPLHGPRAVYMAMSLSRSIESLSLSLFQALTLSQHFPPRAMKCGRFIASCQLASASESRAKEATLFVHRPSFRPNRGEEQRCAAVSCLSACRSLSFPLLLADKQPATAWETRLCGSVRAALDVVHASFSKTQGRWPP